MLESLELFGFKSFADRTLFEFSPGITCVVGPNGSGKSNVVDALKWILGDQSAKSLRGKEMSDVIFNGSTGRRPSGFAEATLTFDNSSRRLPVDAAQVQVGRRLYQSGDSEYLLNGAVVRLKDVRDMFMGTGAGTAAYSIIEQGRVDQILQTNPTNRRIVFEEAAGISKFKSRRIDAERRLERVAQNLLRLTDIFDQVDSQLNATRSQASKAARYRELATELKAAWTGLAADDCRQLSSQLNGHLDELQTLTHELQSLHALIDLADSTQQAAEARLAALDDELRRRDREIAVLRESIAGHDSTIRHQSGRLGELELDLRRLRPQRLELARLVDLSAGELADTASRLTEFEEQFHDSGRQLTKREQELHQLGQRSAHRRILAEQRRTELAQSQEHQSRLTERWASLSSQAESLGQLRSQGEIRLNQIDQQFQSARNQQTLRKDALTQAEEAHQRLHAEWASTNSAQAQLSQQRLEVERQLRTLRERRSAAEARLALLEELEQRQEGIAVGVREILRRADSSHFPPWNSILGLVRDLIEAPSDLAPIIDAALGERAQLVAVTDLDPFLDYFNRDSPPIDGRVGFVSIHPPQKDRDSAAAARSEFVENSGHADLEELAGVYGRADRLVQEHDRAAGIAARVLGDTWIVETLQVAQQVVSRGLPGTRAVTLQGEVLCQNQRIDVGIVPHEASIVSRKSELRRLRNEIHDLNRGIDDCTQRQSILNERASSQLGELDEMSAELKALSQAVAECRAQLDGQNRDVRRFEREMSEQVDQLQTFDNRLQQVQADQNSIGQQIEAAQQQSRTQASELQIEEQELAAIESLLQQVRGDIKTQQFELAKHEERLQGLKATQGRLTRDQKQRQQQLQDMSHRCFEIQQAHRKSQSDVLNCQSQLAMLALQLDDVSRQARIIAENRETLRQQRAKLAGIGEQRHRERRELHDRQHALEFEVQKLRLQLTTLAARIEEEFQTSLEQIVDSGVSAYGNFLSERYGTTAAREIIDGALDSPEVDSSAANLDDSTQHSALVPTYDDVRPELEGRVDRLRRKITMLGTVNTDALAALEELEQRHHRLASQLNDLREAKNVLEDIIRRINHESQRIFLETFETVRKHFQELFRHLFGGGDANIILEDPQDVLECGIEIVARPPGKELRSISLLSGGEKTMTAVAMIFAIFKSKPSPYCILDEVDAALDEANVDRYVKVVKEFAKMTQMLVITHRKRTMTAADVIYGVTMEQPGVSKRISVRFEDVRDNGEIRTAA